VIVGGETTEGEALEVLPVPPSVESTVALLFLTSAVEPVTFTDTWQEADEARRRRLFHTESQYHYRNE